MNMDRQLAARIDRLHQHGVVDMHFDMLMDLYEKRARADVLDADYLPELQAGGMGVLGVAIDQIAQLYAETDRTDHFAICKSHADIEAVRAAGKIALLITMEGVEPLG